MHNVIMQMETCFGCEAPELHGVAQVRLPLGRGCAARPADEIQSYYILYIGYSILYIIY